jgi:D-aminopeptidase
MALRTWRCLKTEPIRIMTGLMNRQFADGWKLGRLVPWLLLGGCLVLGQGAVAEEAPRPRAREAGLRIGLLPTGPLNAITDVPGVRVGHSTLQEGKRLNTGVTAILPHGGNLYEERVPAAIHVGNGFGKLLGVTQVAELGELETPILLTGTLSVWKAADALTDWMLRQPGMESVRSINPVVGETNDGQLSDIRARPIQPQHVEQALESAADGAVAEGSVGAGTGTVAFDFKGGIGTSSRRVEMADQAYTLGVLVQSNFGGDLTIAGVPVGRALAEQAQSKTGGGSGDGSIMIVVATDAPLGARGLERLARRALLGLGRTGSVMSNGSGDYVIAFSTASECRRRRGAAVAEARELGNEAMTPLFQASVEATEEAILNSLFRASTVVGHRRTAQALPLQPTLELLQQAGALSKP